MADVTRCGRCYSHLVMLTGNVLSHLLVVMPGVADGMATIVRVDYFNLRSVMLNRTHPIYVTDGTRQCSYWGMDYWPSYIYWFFYGSIEVLVLPPYYTEIIICCAMTFGIIVVMYWGGGLRCSLNLSKCTWDFSIIFFITLQPVKHESVHHSTPFHDRIFVFGSHQKVLDGFSCSENTSFLCFPDTFLNLRPLVYDLPSAI